MGLLQDLDIVKGNETLAGGIFEELFPSFMEVKYNKPSEYISTYWNGYLEKRDVLLDNEQQKRGVNGKIFEIIIATLLIREKIYPIYMNAKVAFVPNINYDLLLYSTDRGPICLSAKTSFRERYKQADLEAIAMKYVHRRSNCYLITLSEDDANMVNAKQKIGDVIGLDSAVCATSSDFDDVIEEIKELNLVESPEIKVITTNQVVTENKIKAIFPDA
ncbi:hypothetical protein BUL40_00675 [Croceivirga radicis]|uniref:Uncharacterized protein n=1 Tax=Croceivirga radicis TaxID=1929488 RepID=A0A1V6LV98_9FLAO|nr:hypothetical protein [Croceivirga radicis]OQD44102.1 hypothetical protein BUL40_00675 [Croceivirga radicis]